MPPTNTLSLFTAKGKVGRGRKLFLLRNPNEKERRYVRMRSILSVLMGVAVLLVISSCATTEPLREGELRLLKMQVPENGNMILGHDYKFNFIFESDGSAEIIRAVCFCADSGPLIYKPADVSYGSQRGSFNLYMYACAVDSQRMECYVDYVSGGKRQRSNSVFGLIYGIMR